MGLIDPMIDQGSSGRAQHVVLFLDPQEARQHPDLSYLLSFDGVPGVTIRQLTRISDHNAGATARLVSSEGERNHSVPPYAQFKRFASKLAGQFDEPTWQASHLARTMALAFLSNRQQADAVVTGTGPAFVGHLGLISGQRLLSVTEALAVIGASVRLWPVVSIGGTPNLCVPRTSAYHWTVAALLPAAPAWIRRFRMDAEVDSHGRTLAETVLWRAAQALRARDELHEGIRLLEGESAVDEALYHFDVVLTSAVASFDAMARALQRGFNLKVRRNECGLHKQSFCKALAKKNPGLAARLTEKSELGARTRVLTRLRNQIHGVAPSEVLYVRAHDGIVQHRVVISKEVAREVEEVFPGDRKAMEIHGLFFEDFPTLNLAMVTETLLRWLFDVLDAVMADSLAHDAVWEPTEPLPSGPWPEGVGDALAKLAQVGKYPTVPGVGIPASPGTRKQSLRAHAQGMRAVRGE